jgi:multidrug efflux pump
MSRFFINRPIFAWVLAILVMMAGALSFSRLPVSQYPEIASQQVVLTVRYPGASAQTVADTVTQIIEQQITGIDNMLYMSSTSDSMGTATITFTFDNGTDMDIAQVQVQNKLQMAMPMLPDEVQRQGISVTKSAGVLMILTFYAEGGTLSDGGIGDYIGSNVKDSLSRIPGVGSIFFLGSQYAMRVWLDPAKMEQYRLNPTDIIIAIHAQNNQVTGGQIGGTPAIEGQQINFTVNASSRLKDVRQFEEIILRANSDGSQVFLNDVAQVELGSESSNSIVKFNGNPGVVVVVNLSTSANALETSAAVGEKLESLSAFFPPGMKYFYTFDTTPFVDTSIHEVFKTLGEAILLVFLVMYLFLQNIRATLIPTIAIPVVLLGTFGVLAAAGFSINTLTMFGIVLSVGLLVDDAIVVVENVERLMHTENLTPKEAALKSMEQITGALVGVAAVIAAVFIPMAFMAGSVGVIYRQFSLTIVTSMILSALVALILTPALCATLLRKHPESTSAGIFGRFNRWFDRLAARYKIHVRSILRRPTRWVAAFCLGIVVIAFLAFRLPTSFLPDEDQGMLYAIAQLPPGASLERTSAVLSEIEQYIRENETEAVEGVSTTAGFAFSGSGQNIGQAYITLKDWSIRKTNRLSANAVAARIRKEVSRILEARIIVFGPAPVKEMAKASGFEFELLDLTGRGHEALMEARDLLVEKAATHPALQNVRHAGLDDVEQYQLHIDLDKASALSLDKNIIDLTLATYWGGTYVNDFMDMGRTKRVYIQSGAPFRMQPQDFERYYVRNDLGEMVPFDSFLSVEVTKGSPQLERYEGAPAVKIQGEAAAGYSSGEGMEAMEELAAELPDGFGFLWTGLSYQEKQSGSQVRLLLALSLSVVFLCLAALYESWSIPLSVLMVVPTGIIGALACVTLRGMSNDAYFQIGILAVIGLSAKNSILIVEFARELQSEGKSILSATLGAVRIRFRPIIMTSMAFVCGILPLAINSGAGSGAQNAIGTTVVGGVLSASVLGIFFTPMFFVLVAGFFSRKRDRQLGEATSLQPTEQ